ncbi:fructosamine kinase family protein [Priestia filamentosa]|uniref:Fructosamine kinase n=1 Tax=Priestia filamentosa TaxID=1402861 RepID=A0A0H4KMP4_9BACI|nr:fructosamine kinase family protein [Priestia filamentosa]AKO94845.1 fructosamine kinase [Priestia filamentosa]MDT3765185.1 fructosamine kinase family protein [Priestia filamentosa]WCM15764.1 fructosamine kinase family protein [Priestia filamentosa]WRU95476.1 fructosamine kinase family protein [Priestia filamentosa]
MEKFIKQAIYNRGDTSPIQLIRPVSGGDINQASYVKTEKEEYFIKYNNSTPPGFFQQEVQGLKKIKETGVIQVPNVYDFHESTESGEGWLILEWIQGEKNGKTEELLGRQLALMHSVSKDKFGFHHPSYIGMIEQPNQYYDKWAEYYTKNRLLPQIELAKKKGYLYQEREAGLYELLEKMEKWLPHSCEASLLHGDLWGGNWIVGKTGDPYLIDPSVFYGHSEFELSFTELFGGFSSAFYQAYQEVRPLSPEYEERKTLYQLFYLLVHLNLFGEAYGRSVDRVWRYYVG